MKMIVSATLSKGPFSVDLDPNAEITVNRKTRTVRHIGDQIDRLKGMLNDEKLTVTVIK